MSNFKDWDTNNKSIDKKYTDPLHKALTFKSTICNNGQLVNNVIYDNIINLLRKCIFIYKEGLNIHFVSDCDSLERRNETKQEEFWIDLEGRADDILRFANNFLISTNFNKESDMRPYVLGIVGVQAWCEDPVNMVRKPNWEKDSLGAYIGKSLSYNSVYTYTESKEWSSQVTHLVGENLDVTYGENQTVMTVQDMCNLMIKSLKIINDQVDNEIKTLDPWFANKEQLKNKYINFKINACDTLKSRIIHWKNGLTESYYYIEKFVEYIKLNQFSKGILEQMNDCLDTISQHCRTFVVMQEDNSSSNSRL